MSAYGKQWLNMYGTNPYNYTPYLTNVFVDYKRGKFSSIKEFEKSVYEFIELNTPNNEEVVTFLKEECATKSNNWLLDNIFYNYDKYTVNVYYGELLTKENFIVSRYGAVNFLEKGFIPVPVQYLEPTPQPTTKKYVVNYDAGWYNSKIFDTFTDAIKFCDRNQRHILELWEVIGDNNKRLMFDFTKVRRNR